MSFILVALLCGQYADVYVPHKPIGVESGGLVETASSELWVAYRATAANSVISNPVTTSFKHSPDGYNEFGLGLPWVKVTGDSANYIFLGNMTLHYKRRILGSLRWGYLAAKLTAEFPTSPDTFGVREYFGGRRSVFGLGLAYTYELSLLKNYHDIFGRLPLVGTAAIYDPLLYRDHETKSWEVASDFSWGAALEILPLDYAYLGFSVQGEEEVSFSPYLGVRWFWFDLGAAYRTGADSRLDIHLKLYL